MFINNSLSNNVYVVNNINNQYWENLAAMGVSSRTGVLFAIYKKR